MRTGSFLAELRRRNVLRAGALYAAGAWLLVQIATQVFPFFHIAEWVVRWIVVAAAIGFPFALVFSWFYEFTPQGLKLESQIGAGESITRSTGRKLDRWIIAVLGVAVVLLLANTLIWHREPDVESVNPAVASSPAKSIAVLPLVNESGDPQQDYFSDGLSEELISALTQVHDLKVIGRNSSFQFRGKTGDSKAIGIALGVATLLEGTVRKQGERVRIVADLINAADGRNLWSQAYDRDLKDVFAVQSEIATSVAGALKATLRDKPIESTDKPPSGNLDAYTALLQGNFYFERHGVEDFHKAIDFYSDAIRLDSSYALAHANLSTAWQYLSDEYLGGPEAADAYAKARAAAKAALRLDPDLAEAHVAMGWVLLSSDFDYAAAETEFRRALALQPRNAAAKNGLAGLASALGHMDEAVDLARQALIIEPLQDGWYHNLAQYLFSVGRLDEAEQAVRKGIALQPTAPLHYVNLAIIDILRGAPDAALDAARQESSDNWRRFALAMAQHARGDRAAADAALQTLIIDDADRMAFQIATVYALRKQPDRAFEWLDRAWTNRDPGINSLLYDPFLTAYKDDPRFSAFCRKVGLPAPGAAKSGGSLAPSETAPTPGY